MSTVKLSKSQIFSWSGSFQNGSSSRTGGAFFSAVGCDRSGWTTGGFGSGLGSGFGSDFGFGSGSVTTTGGGLGTGSGTGTGTGTGSGERSGFSTGPGSTDGTGAGLDLRAIVLPRYASPSPAMIQAEIVA